MMNRAKKATKRIAYALIAAAAALTAIAAAGAQTYADTGDAGVSLTVRQNVAGSPHSPDARFTYTLKPLSPDNPMPAGSAAGGYTFTIAGNRSAVIGPILFNRQDVYRYELYQTAGAAASGYTYDRRVYTIEIHIDGSLNSYLVILNGAGEKEAELIFENGYDSPDITPPAVTPPEVTPPTVAPPTAPPPEITPSVTAPPAVTPPVAPP
ncbi:MAG: hypothetical protein FWG72_01020, partial [Oscillospiraceae bacterium]|nr:hypothetical protein [Oscillospiraceae bacterium]